MTQPTIHENQQVFTTGATLDDAQAAMIMIHGRGGGPQSIMALLSHVGDERFAYYIPSAANYTWYPHRFIAPRESNEPNLSSALDVITGLVDQIEASGVPADKIMLLGFSQGACLALETAARNPRRYGGVVALSGGLIGADGELVNYPGQLEGTPVFLGCSDVDAHIPLERVQESTRIMRELGAEVTEKIYPNMGHTINPDEVGTVRRMMQGLL